MTTEAMWNAIERLASFSRSTASENQRLMKKAFESTKQWREGDPLLRKESALPRELPPEIETGRITTAAC